MHGSVDGVVCDRVAILDRFLTLRLLVENSNKRVAASARLRKKWQDLRHGKITNV